jgi:hypothetical protein
MNNITTNTYTKGLNQDITPLKYSQESYFNLENFRIVTRDGSSALALENEKGNKVDFRIPSIQGVYKVLAENINISSLSVNSVFFSQTQGSLENLYNNIISNPILAPTIGTDFNVFLKDDHILFVGLNNLTIDGGFNNTNDPNGIQPTVIVAPQESENLRIIHLNYIDNNIIVYTTSNNGDGQIWYVPYNEQSNTPENLNGEFLVPNIHLKYNNLLNLSTEVPINKSIVRKETSKICRIYWTDFNNPARRFNLLDPLALGTDPSDLDFVSNVSFSQPIIKDISDGGSIPYGSVVQFGYILNNNSQDSKVSPLSHILPLYSADDETTSF